MATAAPIPYLIRDQLATISKNNLIRDNDEHTEEGKRSSSCYQTSEGEAVQAGRCYAFITQPQLEKRVVIFALRCFFAENWKNGIVPHYEEARIWSNPLVAVQSSVYNKLFVWCREEEGIKSVLATQLFGDKIKGIIQEYLGIWDDSQIIDCFRWALLLPPGKLFLREFWERDFIIGMRREAVVGIECD